MSKEMRQYIDNFRNFLTENSNKKLNISDVSESKIKFTNFSHWSDKLKKFIEVDRNDFLKMKEEFSELNRERNNTYNRRKDKYEMTDDEYFNRQDDIFRKYGYDI